MKLGILYSAIQKRIDMKNHWLLYVILFFVFIFYMGTRLWMWIEYGMGGFGYDTGIYRHIIKGYFFNSGNIAFGFSSYSNWLMILGNTIDSILFGWYIFLSIIILYGIYRVTHVYFDHKIAAVFSVILYSISITQYEFFWWYYYRQFLSLFFILISFLLIYYRSYLLIFLLISIGIIHPLSLIPFGLSMIIYLFFVDEKTKKFIFLSGFISLFCLFILNWEELIIYIHDFFIYNGSAQNFVNAGYKEFTGQFIGWIDWLKYSIWYIPFSVLGILKYFKKQRLLVIFLLVNILLMIVQMVFYRRFIIFIDVIMIIFAGIYLADIWIYIQKKSYRYIIYGLCILCAIFLFIKIGNFIFNKSPLIYPLYLESIKHIPDYVTDSDYIVSINSMYAPWLRGYSEKKVIAPGLFEYNKWNRKQWNDFWFSHNIEMKLQMLREYGISPIYIYKGDTPFYIGPSGRYITSFLIRVDL